MVENLSPSRLLVIDDDQAFSRFVRKVALTLGFEVTVTADLFDPSGSLIGRYPAAVDNQQLPPTESSKFHLVASGVTAFAAIRWETTSKGIRSAQPPPAPPPG